MGRNLLRVRVYAPGSIGNVGPGLDVLGLAVAGRGDTVAAERTRRPGIVVTEPGDPRLPRSATKHSTAIAAQSVLERAGLAGRVGLTLAIEKGLPISGGQGGSAASAVAGAVAANLLIGSPLGDVEIMLAALDAELQVAGRHLDNIAPSLLGGLALIRSLDPLDVVGLPTPRGLLIVLAHPEQEFETKRARSVLPARVTRAIALHQAAQVAAIVAGAALGDVALMGRAIDDRIAEPARASLMKGFREAKAAALDAGAYGCSISGGGPTAFAIVADRPLGRRVGMAMCAAYGAQGVRASFRVATVDRQGARRI
ncbi:MAG: homoserine kinase [Gemmatimonadota bacterium]